MKNSNTIAAIPSALDALQARVAYRLAGRLSEQAASLDDDLSERLRFAREKALERAQLARAAQTQPVVGISASGAGLLGNLGGWWVRLGSVLPLVALAAGLLLIRHLHGEAQIAAAAEIDAELLADDLPPAAYSDAGFVEFLKTPRD